MSSPRNPFSTREVTVNPKLLPLQIEHMRDLTFLSLVTGLLESMIAVSKKASDRQV